MHNMAEIEKAAVGFPVMCHLLAGNLHKVAAPYFQFIFIFNCIKRTVQSSGMLGCWEILSSVMQFI